METTRTDLIRAVTDAEVAYFRKNGWVKLEKFIPPEVARDMRVLAEKRLAAVSGSNWQATDEGGAVRVHGIWTEWRFPARDMKKEPFASIALSPMIAENQRRLSGRKIPIRYWSDIVACKIPMSSGHGSGPTTYHQDYPNHSYDRVGSYSFWIALDDVTPEQGSMRFVEGSQTEGPLGRTAIDGRDHVQQYPELLERHKLSEPFTLRAGDATCHDDLVVHGAPVNNGDRPRWSYIVVTLPGDALYNGARYGGTDNIGLEIGKPFDHPLFPVIG